MSSLGKKVYHNSLGQNKSFIEGTQPDGWILGRFIDEKKKLEANLKRREKVLNLKWYNNGINQGLFQQGEQPEGWIPGRLAFAREASLGTEIYNDGEKEYFLSESDSKEGLVKGRLKSTLDKMKLTTIDKYGVENIFQTEKVKEINKLFWQDSEKAASAKNKRIATCLEKYGTEYSLLAEEVKEKSKNTLLEKYGVESISQLDSTKEKVANTKYERYGLSGYNNPDKVKLTVLEKYGVEYACQLPLCKLKGNDSKPNLRFALLLDEHGILYEREFPVNNKSFDFKVGNILIEVDPTITHNSTFSPYGCEPKGKYYHYNKSKLAEENGFRCIHIFDWEDSSKIIYLLKDRKRIFARKCEIKEVSIKESNLFLDKYHLQGSIKSDIRLGLYYLGELVSVMTFGKPRYNKNYLYELLRYCSSYCVVGGEEKLFKYFLANYNPESIISYCDRSKFLGNIYNKLGFMPMSASVSRHWYNMKTGRHITDNLLRQRGYDLLFGTNYGKGYSNEQLMIENNFVEIYDCGLQLFIWKSKNEA